MDWNRRILALCLLLGACGGDSAVPPATPPPPPPPPPPVVNVPPVIDGIPVTTLRADEFYEFLPSASDPDGDPLTFIIGGQPAWSTFDEATGQLYGTPAREDVGEYPDIRISVSDGQATATLPDFSITVEPALPVTAPSGLDTRPQNPACAAVMPPGDQDIVIERVFEDLDLHNVTALTQAPGDDTYWYFTTRNGRIGRFDNDPDVDTFDMLLDYRNTVIEPYDGGLLQLVFHPAFPADRRVFVNYSTSPADGVNPTPTSSSRASNCRPMAGRSIAAPNPCCSGGPATRFTRAA